jgi:hypothetical protein
MWSAGTQFAGSRYPCGTEALPIKLLSISAESFQELNDRDKDAIPNAVGRISLAQGRVMARPFPTGVVSASNTWASVQTHRQHLAHSFDIAGRSQCDQLCLILMVEDSD